MNEIQRIIKEEFTIMVHSDHREIKFKDGVVIAHKPEEEKHQHTCYVCFKLRQLERRIIKSLKDGGHI